MKRSLALCLFVILSATATASLAATRTFTGPGNFSSVSNWDGGTTLPAAGDDLLIDGVCTFDNAAPSLQYAAVTLNSGATLNWPVGGTNTLTLNSIVGNASALDMTNGGKLVLLGTGTPFGPNIAFTGGTGEVRYQGSGALSIALATYNDLTINGGGTASLSAATTVNNNLNIASGTLLAGANILTINNDAIVALGSSFDTGTVAHTIAGNLVLDGVLTGSGSVYLNGAGKSVSGGGSAGSGTFVRFNASHNILAGSNLTINGGMFLSVYVTVTNSGTVTAGSGISGTDATAVWLNSVNGTLDFRARGSRSPRSTRPRPEISFNT